jgi:hypothetical protein
MASLDIDTAYIEKNFDQVEDEADFVDRSKKVTKRSSVYGYSIEIPAYWYGLQNNFDEDEVMYTFSGGELEIFEAEGNASSLVSSIAQYANTNEARATGLTIKESATATINGKTAYKLVANTAKPITGMPFTEIYYLFDTNDGVLVFNFTVYDANATASNLQRLNDAAQSIRFN